VRKKNQKSKIKKKGKEKEDRSRCANIPKSKLACYMLLKYRYVLIPILTTDNLLPVVEKLVPLETLFSKL
jgi:hypothetical protein